VRARIVIVASCMLVCGGLATGLGAAQAPPPTVTVTLGPGPAVSVSGAENLPAGPARIEFRTEGRRPASGSLVALRPGQTLDAVQRAVRQSEESFAPLKRVVTFEAGGSALRGAPYATTVDLKPGVTYVAANTSGNPRNFRYATFTVGTAAGGAERPAPAATVGLYDYAFGMPATLPRRGTVRFENRGERLHIAVAFPLKRGASRTAAVRALINNREKRLGKLIVGRDVRDVLGLVSGGSVNDVEVNFPRTGNYVLACFISDGEPGSPGHNKIGMVTPFRVR